MGLGLRGRPDRVLTLCRRGRGDPRTTQRWRGPRSRYYKVLVCAEPLKLEIAVQPAPVRRGVRRAPAISALRFRDPDAPPRERSALRTRARSLHGPGKPCAGVSLGDASVPDRDVMGSAARWIERIGPRLVHMGWRPLRLVLRIGPSRRALRSPEAARATSAVLLREGNRLADNSCTAGSVDLLNLGYDNGTVHGLCCVQELVCEVLHGTSRDPIRKPFPLKVTDNRKSDEKRSYGSEDRGEIVPERLVTRQKIELEKNACQRTQECRPEHAPEVGCAPSDGVGPILAIAR